MKRGYRRVGFRMMMFLIVVFAVGTLSHAAAQGSVCPSTTMQGTDFWTTFLFNQLIAGQEGVDSLALLAIGDSGTVVSVERPSTGWDTTVVIGNRKHITIGVGENQFACAQVSDLGFHISSDSPISLFAINYVTHTSDLTPVLPTLTIDTVYVVQDYPSQQNQPQFAVVAVEDSTHIRFTTPAQVFGTWIDPDSTLEFILDRGQSLLLAGTGEASSFSGMRVESDGKLFALFHGGRNPSVPEGLSGRDHLFEQAIPPSAWGREFVVVVPDGVAGCFVGITAEAEKCDVAIAGKNVTTLRRGQTYTHFLSADEQAMLVKTSHPVEVITYLPSYEYDEVRLGDPSSATIPSIDSGVCEAQFVLPSSQFVQQWVLTLAVPTYAVGAMQLDGLPVGNVFSEVAFTGGVYSYATLLLNDDSTLHRLENRSARFVATIYGLGNWESSAFSVGQALRTTPLIPEGSIVAEDDRVCEGDTLWLKAEGVARPRWGAVPSAPELSSQQGQEQVYVVARQQTTYMLYSPNGFLLDTFSPSLLPSPQLCLSLSSDTVNFDHPFIELHNCTPSTIQSEWHFADGLVLMGTDVRRRFHFPQPEPNHVQLITCIESGCCTDTVVTLHYKAENVWFPNAFAPGTEQHRTFGCITTLNVSDYEMTIYNRRGQRVFSTEEVEQGWDGSLPDGSPAPQGTYICRWQLRTTTGERRSGYLTFTLLR